ncbi:hypothetical protein JHK85_013073 [Glycine max]|nr:hypothetical protein JHK85_013073 [Glycine max]
MISRDSKGVPSGGVGCGSGYRYSSNDEFKQAVCFREIEDVASLEEKLGRALSKQERSRIGVSKLRLFLEELLQKRYISNVPLIIPLLEKEYWTVTRKLSDINQELSTLDEAKLKEKGRAFHDMFLTKLSLLLKGTVVAPPDKFGETLQDERINGGAFIGADGVQFPHKLIPNLVKQTYDDTGLKPTVTKGKGGRGEGRLEFGIGTLARLSLLNFLRIVFLLAATETLLYTVYTHIQNAGMRLYGGAQYHRAMGEFCFVVGGIKCPPITREEIVNACGVEDIHDGTNYSRTACVIAVAKARDTFEPFLHQLGSRLLYILKRLLPISVFLLQKDCEYLSGHEVFLRRAASAFNNFAESTEKSCREKCMEDLVSTTRYVSWPLHNKSRAGLRLFLDSFGGTEHSNACNNPTSTVLSQTSAHEKEDTKSQPDVKLCHVASGTDSSSSIQTTETKLADLLDSTLWNRRLAPSSERIVYGLVQQIFHGIREYFLVSTELKFNCFLLMPIVDKLPALLREDLESAFQDDLDNVFDITNMQHSFGQQKRETEIELKRTERNVLAVI